MPPSARALFDVDGYLERQQEAGIELSVLSNALLEDTEGDELVVAKTENDFLADLVARYPDRFAALAGVNAWGGSPWIEEAERALEMGFAGFVFEAGRDGLYLDAPESGDFFELANEHGKLVMVHPSRSPIGLDRIGGPMMSLWIGRPFDTGICLCRMLMADTLSRYPNVRLVVCHGGGVAPMLLGRLDQVHAAYQRMAAAGGGAPPGSAHGGGGSLAQAPPTSAALAVAVEEAGPSQRLDSVYLDTACYHPSAVLAAIASVGVDRVVFGSDHPPAVASPLPSVQLIEQLELEDSDKEKILSGNARRLLEGARA